MNGPSGIAPRWRPVLLTPPPIHFAALQNAWPVRSGAKAARLFAPPPSGQIHQSQTHGLTALHHLVKQWIFSMPSEQSSRFAPHCLMPRKDPQCSNPLGFA